MAQTKARAPAKRPGGSKSSKKSQARSRGSSSKARSSAKPASSHKSRNSRKPSSTTAVGNAADKATDAVGSAAGKATTAVGHAGTAVGHAATKAKIPLVASGAAIAGAAGGVVLGTRHARRHRGVMPRRPQVKASSGNLAKAAKEVGSFGVQLGHLATELQRAREGANGGRHRSPVEVVLEGLTARRSRA